MLFVRQRRALAGRSAWNEEVDARVNLSLPQSPQSGLVKRAIAAKGCDKSRACACKHDVVPSFFLSAQFAENFSKFEYAFPAVDPPCGLQRTASKAIAAARRMPQRDGIGGRIKTNFMCARMGPGAIGREREPS